MDTRARSDADPLNGLARRTPQLLRLGRARCGLNVSFEKLESTVLSMTAGFSNENGEARQTLVEFAP